MDALYKSAFRKFIKKQRRPFQLAIEDETGKIRNKPDIGKATLHGVAVTPITKALG